MKIYSARHGQTDYNKEDLILGVTDLPLNSTGFAQAEEFAKAVEFIDSIVSGKITSIGPTSIFLIPELSN
mgnify:CR=1 FL=1